MTSIEIDRVDLVPPDFRAVRGYHLDVPVAGWSEEGYALPIEGWYLTHRGPAASIRILHDNVLMWEIQVGFPRPDLAHAYSEVEGASGAGFRSAVSALRLPREFILKVEAILEDGTSHEFATIRGRRGGLPIREPELRPLLVTTLGRTGSTWLIALLAEHPEIVAYKPFVYEPRVVSYWLDLLKVLSEPMSFLQGLRADLTGDYWWIGDKRSSPLPPMPAERVVRAFVSGNSVETVAGTCGDLIEGFYREVSREQGKEGASFFTEKCWPDYFVPGITREIYPGSKEIILMRDLRDAMCSMAAFTSKLGYEAFGRELAEDELGHIAELRRNGLRMLESYNERNSDALLVRYEDLILSPKATLETIFDYLNVDSRAMVVNGVRERAAAVNPDVQRAHQTSASAESSIGRWRRDLSREVRKACDREFGDILDGFGYEP